MRKYIHRPWINRKGSLRPDKEIRKMGQMWNKNTWDEYLQETVGIGRREKVFGEVKNIQFITADEAQAVYNSLDQAVRCNYLYEEITKLDPIEQKIIYCRFWKKLHISEIVRELKTPRTTVKRKLSKILEKLKSGICCKVVDLNIERILRSIPPPPELLERSI